MKRIKGTWGRRILRGLSLTSALFIFQACYGTPQDFGYDLFIKGDVRSKSSGLPIKGIKVSVEGDIQYYLTDTDGQFSFYTERLNQLKIKFEDIDSSQNGLFQSRDTLLTIIPSSVYLKIQLEGK
jgi:hypothetical protein